MKKTLIYVRALNLSSESSKYKHLKGLFDDSYYVNWPNEDNFNFDAIVNEIRLISKTNRMQNDSVVIVGVEITNNLIMQKARALYKLILNKSTE